MTNQETTKQVSDFIQEAHCSIILFPDTYVYLVCMWNSATQKLRQLQSVMDKLGIDKDAQSVEILIEDKAEVMRLIKPCSRKAIVSQRVIVDNITEGTCAICYS